VRHRSDRLAPWWFEGLTRILKSNCSRALMMLIRVSYCLIPLRDICFACPRENMKHALILCHT
jgi:hypothetical protein